MKKWYLKFFALIIVTLFISCTNPSSPTEKNDDETEGPVPKNLSEIVDSTWLFAESDQYWLLEIDETNIDSYFSVDGASDVNQSQIAIPEDNVLSIILTTDIEREYSVTFADANSMTLSDEDGLSFIFHRLLNPPYDLGISQWDTEDVAAFWSSIEDEYSITCGDYAGTVYAEGFITEIDGNIITIMDLDGNFQTITYSISGSVLTFTLDGTTLSADYVNPIPASLIGTTWTTSYETYDYSIDFYAEYYISWSYSAGDGSSSGVSKRMIEWESDNIIKLDDISLFHSGALDYEAIIFLDISDPDSGIICSHDSTEIMTFTKD